MRLGLRTFPPLNLLHDADKREPLCSCRRLNEQVGLSYRVQCGAMSAAESFEVERDGATGAMAPTEAGRPSSRGLAGGGSGSGSVGNPGTVADGEAAREFGGPGPARSVCQSYLSGGKIYSCCHCRAHLASHDEIISKSFQGHHGRAYLFNNLCAPTRHPRRVVGVIADEPGRVSCAESMFRRVLPRNASSSLACTRCVTSTAMCVRQSWGGNT